MWYSQLASIQNAWKTPILNSDDIQWVSMHSANREMEYAAWMDWLCLGGDSVITTENGNLPLRELVGQEFRIWDGDGYHAARAVETGVREIAMTKLSNGSELRSSPEHLFRVRVEGVVDWVAQKDLVQGDEVLLDPKTATPDETEYPTAVVVEAWQTGQSESMFDVEVFNDRHLFFANGIAVHNTKLICAVFGIDPVEINFIFGGGGSAGGGSAMFDRRPNAAEVTESKDKGLRPLLTHMEDHLNQHIVWDMNPDFEFSWTGFDAAAEAVEREARMTEVTRVKTVNQIRAEMDEPPLPGKLGDLILDPTFFQWMMAQEAAQQEGGEMGGEMGEGGPPGAPGAPPGGAEPPMGPTPVAAAEGGAEDDEEDFLQGMHPGVDDDDDHDDLLAASYTVIEQTEDVLRKSWYDGDLDGG